MQPQREWIKVGHSDTTEKPCAAMAPKAVVARRRGAAKAKAAAAAGSIIS